VKQVGVVLNTFSADKSSKGLPRPMVKSLELVEGYGIVNDKFANGNLDKTVMIVGQASYQMAKDEGIDLTDGSYGENILFDFDPHEFDEGTIFQIGDALIEITEKCTICKHLAVFGAKLPKLMKNHRGLYCKILKGGVICKDDSVYMIKEKGEEEYFSPAAYLDLEQKCKSA